jgi:outer membrane receptor protein involved in Fe transport
VTATQEFIALPRFAMKYQIDDSLFVRLGSGLYSQAPEPQQVDDNYGNPDLRSPRSAHLALSAEKDFREGSSRGLVLSGGLFHRWFSDLVEQSTDEIERDGVTVPEYYSNTGDGRSYGAEVLGRVELAPFTGWLSYTLSRSVRSSDGGAEQLFQYDQTHLLTAIAAVDLPRNWRISTRVRYTTGNPYTPITGSVFDADNDVYFPVRGTLYSERLNPFFQLDFRIDKKWVYDTWILWLYLDVQNATNRKNVEQLQYAYDYSESATVSGLPVVPSFGLKAEF